MPNIGQTPGVHDKEPSYFSGQTRAAKRFYKPKPLSESHADAPFAIQSGGWERCAPGYRITRTTFPYITLEFVVAGTGSVELSGKAFPLIPGVFFSYGPGMPHAIANDSATPLDKYFICVAADDARTVFGDEIDMFGKVLHSARPYELQQTFEELTNYGLENSAWSGRICESLVRLLVLKMKESSIENADYSGMAYAKYQHCLSVIDRNFMKLRNLNQIAEECRVEVSYLCKLFRRFNHQSPYQYFLRLNMNHAADLLLQKNIQIQELAERMQYPDPLHFSRTFKKVMGVSPREFMKINAGRHLTESARD